jgi:hypothetical protein
MAIEVKNASGIPQQLANPLAHGEYFVVSAASQ